MALVTIKEAIELTGRSRRSIYRDAGKGVITWSKDREGRRVIDTSELMRVYGPIAMPDDTPDTPDTAQVAQSDLLAELRALREEVAGLREEMREMRRLPAPPSITPEPVEKPREPEKPAQQAKEAEETPTGTIDFSTVYERLMARLDGES